MSAEGAAWLSALWNEDPSGAAQRIAAFWPSNATVRVLARAANHGEWEPVLAGCEKALGLKGLPVAIPIGRESQLEGVVDLIGQVAYRPARESNKVLQASIPAALTGPAAEARKRLYALRAEE